MNGAGWSSAWSSSHFSAIENVRTRKVEVDLEANRCKNGSCMQLGASYNHVKQNLFFV
jgi:hypothetical protein